MINELFKKINRNIDDEIGFINKFVHKSLNLEYL